MNGTKWVLNAMGTTGNLTPALATPDVTLQFTNATNFVGNAGCNSYSGQYESTTAGVLKMSDIIRTLMLCVQPGVMDQERDYIDALDEAKAYSVSGGKLSITGDGKLLVFDPA